MLPKGWFSTYCKNYLSAPFLPPSPHTAPSAAVTVEETSARPYTEKKDPWSELSAVLIAYLQLAISEDKIECIELILHPKYNLNSTLNLIPMLYYTDISTLNCFILIYSFDVFQITEAVHDW